jgi:hypothetical protein
MKYQLPLKIKQIMMTKQEVLLINEMMILDMKYGEVELEEC